jgi:hypothetical protein
MTKETFMAIAESYYEEFKTLPDASNFYDYEKNFVEMWQRMGKEYMENQLNASSATDDRRKKKLLPDLGK